MKKKKKRNYDEVINQLEFDKNMILLDPMNGETYTLEELKAYNYDNYLAYLADDAAIKAIKKLKKYEKLGSLSKIRKTMKKEKNKKC